MTYTLIRMFRRIDQAQEARNALLAGGFSEDAVQLDATEDEAGTAAGNFVLQRQDTPQGRSSGVDVKDEPAHHDPSKGTNSQAATTGHYILTVAADDDSRAERAREIVERYGALVPAGLKH